MDYTANLLRAVDYIETHLSGSCDLKAIARQAYLSPYHFHRVFLALTGDTPGDYVRKRRLTFAAHRILETDAKIIDVAFDAGFESHEAFSRSFKQLCGMTPVEFRKSGKFDERLMREKLSESKILCSNRRIKMELRPMTNEESRKLKKIGWIYAGMIAAFWFLLAWMIWLMFKTPGKNAAMMIISPVNIYYILTLALHRLPSGPDALFLRDVICGGINMLEIIVLTAWLTVRANNCFADAGEKMTCVEQGVVTAKYRGSHTRSLNLNEVMIQQMKTPAERYDNFRRFGVKRDAFRRIGEGMKVEVSYGIRSGYVFGMKDFEGNVLQSL